MCIENDSIMFKTVKFVLAASAVATLVACGGGGGGSTPAAATGPVTSTLTFPIAAGIRAQTVSGLSKNFAVTGSCTGNGTRTSSAANTVATFEGVTGFSSTSTMTITVAAPCNSIAQTSTSYYDTNYTPLGFNSIGVNYGVYAPAPVYPTTVTVGSTATIGTETLYTNSSKTVPNGTVSQSYVVTADTATTAIVNVISKSFTTGGTLTSTEQDYFRVDASGNLTPLSIDLLYSNGSHLVLTYN
jgi:hypothetical protein